LKVRKYFEHYFKLEEEENQRADSLMSQLTKHLKEEVLVDIYKKTLRQSRLLRENFSEQTLDRLCIFIKEKKFAPEEIVFQRGELVQKMIFILSGELHIYTNNTGEIEDKETLLRSFKPGFVIGEREFATGRMYDYNGKADKFTQVAILEYDSPFLFYQVMTTLSTSSKRTMRNSNVSVSLKIISTSTKITKSSAKFAKSVAPIIDS
jgi:hypothetical protein